MANTTWNPSDKTAGVTLTGSNLIATASATSNGVRAVDKQTTGKFYWEYTCNVSTLNVTAVGVASGGLNLAAAVNSSQPAGVSWCALLHGGALVVDGSNQVIFSALTSGNVVCIAHDIGGKQIWFRVGAAGNWNNSGTANPATGAGGISVPKLGGAFAVYPAAWFGGASEQTTANFGDTAFTGTVPSGFTSGFTAGATPAVNEIVTQVALEEWGVGTPSLQLTQIAVEQWAQVSSVNTQMVLTQIAVEEWASVPPPPVLGGPMISVII